jgi:hypothetical protein
VAPQASGRVSSICDATVTSLDPFPLDPASDYPDPVREGLKAPVSRAMMAVYENPLNWRPDSSLQLGNARGESHVGLRQSDLASATVHDNVAHCPHT